MPVNKSSQVRLEVIDECLRNDKRKWTKTDLLKYLNRRLESKFGPGNEISSSQLRYDLEHLQTEYDAPVEMYREGRHHYYKYNNPEFSIKQIPVDEQDLIVLKTAVNILQQLKGFDISQSIRDVLIRIGHRNDYNGPEYNSGLEFDHTPYTRGITHLEDIYGAINNKIALKLNYHPYQSKQAGTYIVHPYLLKEYRHRWYLLGLDHQKNKIGTFALDRIRTIKVAKMEYVTNSTLNPQKYFSDIIGISKPENAVPQNINLLFSKTFSPYIISQPLHDSQQIIEHLRDGSLHINLKLVVNRELISLLLSFGKELRVLAPDILALEVRGAALMMLNNYKE